jgi:ketosteroid isomerase-like protein
MSRERARSARRWVVFVALGLSGCTATPLPPDEAGVTATLEAFYAAVKKGDGQAAMALIAPDAVFLEGGRLETRQEYEENHLPADIEFEREVDGKRGPIDVTFEGNVAWAIATTEYEGTFQAEPVNFVSAQLMVLSRDASNAWRIRSIHWSSRRR